MKSEWMLVFAFVAFGLIAGCASAQQTTTPVASNASSKPSEDLNPKQLTEWLNDHADGQSSFNVSLDLRSIAFSNDRKTIFAGGNFYGEKGKGVVTAAILRSTNFGKSWQRLSPVLAQHSINQLQVLESGEVLAFSVMESEGSLFEGVLASPDEGMTWTYHAWNRKEDVAAEIKKVIGCCREDLTFAKFADRENGIIILQSDQKMIRLQTADGGQNFSPSPTRIFQPTPRPEYLFKVNNSTNTTTTGAHFVEIWKVDLKGHPQKLFAQIPERWLLQASTLEFKPVQ